MTGRVRLIDVTLTRDEVRLLGDLAHFYERSMGRFRIFVRATAGSDTRRRFRFVAEESTLLADFAETVHQDMTEKGIEVSSVSLTPRALVAFWGRVLASLNTPRARRRLSDSQIEQRMILSGKLAHGARLLAGKDGALLRREIGTRRPAEADWMTEQLRLEDENP